MERIAVVAMGDPRSPACWSGTSSKIIEELENGNLRCEGIDAHIVSRTMRYVYGASYQTWRLLLSCLGTPRGLPEQIAILQSESRNDFNLTRGPRQARARHVIRRMHTLGIRKALHMVQHALPAWNDPETEHYLMFDSTFHIECGYQPLQSRYPPAIRRHIERAERQMFAQVKHFFPIGEYVKADLICHYGIDPRRITPVGTGLGKIVPYFGDKDYGSGTILCTARARLREKGVFLLLDAFQIAYAQNPELKLTIVGHPSFRKRIGDLPGVTLLDFIPQEQLQSLFEKSALFCMPALHEPWGLVYLEAMACRTPILALHRNALAEITGGGECGILVEDASPRKVADALLMALGDPGSLRRMGLAAQQRALHHFGWERAGRLIADVIGVSA